MIFPLYIFLFSIVCGGGGRLYIYSTLFFSYYEKLFVIPLEGGGLSLLVSFSLPLNILGGSNRDPSIIVCSPILLTLLQINRQNWGASILKVVSHCLWVYIAFPLLLLDVSTDIAV